MLQLSVKIITNYSPTNNLTGLYSVYIVPCEVGNKVLYEGRTESHEQLFFASELGTADEGEYGSRWNQLLCYP